MTHTIKIYTITSDAQRRWVAGGLSGPDVDDSLVASSDGGHSDPSVHGIVIRRIAGSIGIVEELLDSDDGVLSYSVESRAD